MRTTEKKKEELERDIHIKREREEQEKKKIEASTVLEENIEEVKEKQRK